MGQRDAQPCKIGLAVMRIAKSGYRVGGVAIPIVIEDSRGFANNRTDRYHIQVAKIVVITGIEIMIADIASADDGRDVVCDERLVVHAPIEPPAFEQKLGGL